MMRAQTIPEPGCEYAKLKKYCINMIKRRKLFQFIGDFCHPIFTHAVWGDKTHPINDP